MTDGISLVVLLQIILDFSMRIAIIYGAIQIPRYLKKIVDALKDNNK